LNPWAIQISIHDILDSFLISDSVSSDISVAIMISSGLHIGQVSRSLRPQQVRHRLPSKDDSSEISFPLTGSSSLILWKIALLRASAAFMTLIFPPRDSISAEATL
jgi:hypothetical protein